MKQINLILFSLLLLVSCRKEADPSIYYGEVSKLAYGDSYVEQFDYIWRNISTGYVFWDIDETPWDLVYEQTVPKLQELDNMVSKGEAVPDEKLEEIYMSAMGGMKDQHMIVYVENRHALPYDLGYIIITPGFIEADGRPEYLEPLMVATVVMSYFNKTIETVYADDQFKIIDHKYIKFNLDDPQAGQVNNISFSYNLFQLPDGRLVPYFWHSHAYLTPILKYLGEESDAGIAAEIVDTFLRTVADTPREQIAGFILDNRTNTGGIQDDLDYLIGSYINKEETAYRTRYKEGPGRLEYSVWTDCKQKPTQKYHRDISAEGIPYIILTDTYSISMAEVEAIVAKNLLPTVYTIGERTFGATGPLQSDQYSLTYGGIFGKDDMTDGHYVYTSHFEAEFNGKNYEGKGFEPDLIIHRKDCGKGINNCKPVIDAALNKLMK